MASIFRIPRVIVTGLNAYKNLVDLPELINKSKALFITDNVKIDPEIEEDCIADLRRIGISVQRFNEVRDVVSSETVNAAVRTAKDVNADVIIAAGGRLAMHLGRLAAMLMTNGGVVEDYTEPSLIKKPPMTSVMIATTSSSGVAVSTCVCYTNDKTGKRYCYSDPKLLPAVAILDPGLSNWLSPQDLALDGVISLGYAVEALASRLATPVTDACALKAITAMMRCLPEAYAQSHQVESREKLMFAQQLVSMASSNVMANMVCKLAGQIESLTHIPMGNAVAALLPNVIESLKNKIPEKIQMMAEAILAGDNTLEHGPDHPFAANEVRGIIQRLDMPLKLSFLGFEEHHISQLINSLDEHTLATEAPIPTDSDSLEKLLKASL